MGAFRAAVAELGVVRRLRTRHPAMSDSFKQLEGEQLGAVTFVQDYLQLAFDGPGFSIFMPVTVESGGLTTRSGDTQFRNALCEQIAKRVRSVVRQEAEALIITFHDDSRISISLRESDYSGPEAFTAHGFGESLIVHRIDD